MSMTHECGAELPADAVVCSGCGGLVDPTGAVGVPDLVAPAPAVAPDPGLSRPAPSPVTPVGSPACSLCRRPLPATATVCPFCGTVTAPGRPGAVVGVLLPDGSATTLPEDEPLVLGRESEDPTARAALACLDTVSRQHARLRLSSGQLHVEDLRSTNGTYVDGVEVVRPVEVPLHSRVAIGLGTSITVYVVPRPEGLR